MGANTCTEHTSEHCRCAWQHAYMPCYLPDGYWELIAVLAEVEPPQTSTVTLALQVRQPPCVAIGEKTSTIIRRQARLRSCGLKPFPERMEAPAGLACPSPFPRLRGAGLIQPSGLAQPQTGL